MIIIDKKDLFIQARISKELREKINEDMKRLGIESESDYLRKVLSGEVSSLSDIKEQLVERPA